MDQSQRAAPHGFSQLATSFLACSRLGIPRVPLLRLASVPKIILSNDLNFTAKPHTHLFLHLALLALDSALTSRTKSATECLPQPLKGNQLLDLSKPKYSKICPPRIAPGGVLCS